MNWENTGGNNSPPHSRCQQLLIFYGIHKCDLVPKTTISRHKHEFAVKNLLFLPFKLATDEKRNLHPIQDQSFFA